MISYKLNVGRKEIPLKHNMDLIDLDCYTTRFDDDSKLKIDLYNRGTISLKDDYEVFVSYNYNGRQTIPVLYKKHLNYIDPNNLGLTYAILENYVYSNFEDVEFLDKLISCYGYSKYNSQVIMPIRNARDGFDVTPNEQREIVEDLCYTLMRDSKTGKYNYSGMRKFGLLVYRYEEMKKLKKIKEEMYEPSEAYLFPDFKGYEGEQLSLFKKN